MNPESLKLIVVAAARPNFMKVAPLLKAAERHNNEAQKLDAPRLDFRLVHTGQHYDRNMSEIFFEELGIRAPDINLEVGSGSHAAQTANVMLKFEPVCLEERPDWVVVVGDVNSTMACTVVAAKLGIRVAHIEAGLRSFDRSMPEEINRMVTDAIADLLLTPSVDADENLLREGVPAWRIQRVGNIMIDALLANLERARSSRILQQLELERGRYVYVTLHRPSNVDDAASLKAIVASLGQLAGSMKVVFPVHPRTRERMGRFGLQLPASGAVKLIEPVGYLDSLHLTEQARFVLTDSGGLQEEATFFRTPCLTLRPNTERPVTVKLGSNRLTDVTRLPADIETLMADGERRGVVPPLWDGHTAERILGAIAGAAQG